MDNAFIMVLDPGDDMERGQLFFFNDPSKINDPNFMSRSLMEISLILMELPEHVKAVLTGYINKPFSYMDRTGAVQQHNTTVI